MKALARACLVALCLFGLSSQPVLASLRVNPLIVYLEPTSQGSSSVIQLTNVTDVELPFEVNVVRRTVVEGAEVDVSADDDFVIFPPQMIIAPGETQTLRIQWLPDRQLTRSESYYVYVTQVPVEIAPGMSGIRVNYRFGISAHVIPPGVSPNLHVVAIEPATGSSGEAGFEMTIVNRGTEFARLSEQSLSFANGPSWDPKRFKEEVGTGFLLPGQESRVFIAYDGTPPKASEGSLTKGASQ